VKLRFCFLSLLLCLCMMITGTAVSTAQELQPLEPEWLRQMYEEGWQKVEEGVLQRDAGGGEFETFAYGEQGLRWVIQGYQSQLDFFETKHNALPTEELAAVIEQLTLKIDQLNEELVAAPSAESFDGSEMVACTGVSFGGQASADPQEAVQGVKAAASAFFRTDCVGSIGDIFAVAHAEATNGAEHTVVVREEPLQGASIESSVTASANGSTNCYSWAQSSVTMGGNVVYQTGLKENYACPPVVPVVASASGPASVTTDYYNNSGCANVTWTASATGGHPGYTYSWYIGTDPTVQGTGSTFTKSYCNTSQSVTVKVVASDSDGHTDDETYTTNIIYKPAFVAAISGPTSVTSSTPCTTVSWTVSASGTGHSGFTYKWYIGTTLQTTTSTTFSKQFCNTDGTSQTVTVKATATASDGHQDTDTHTTSITFPPPPLAASVSGPASVQLTTSTECKSITWIASATGGTPGYTYSWYIGTSTTIQGTAATLTKTYCGAQTINVKVTVRDAAASTVNATFTTTFRPPLTASISGPASVQFFTIGECKSITWTANTTGGTPGYTYSWYIGTSTTVQGTGSTLTQTFCGAQVIDVKLTVRDSASQSASATFTTTMYRERPQVETCTSGGIQVICQ
jgi:hypothetical protein